MGSTIGGVRRSPKLHKTVGKWHDGPRKWAPRGLLGKRWGLALGELGVPRGQAKASLAAIEKEIANPPPSVWKVFSSAAHDQGPFGGSAIASLGAEVDLVYLGWDGPPIQGPRSLAKALSMRDRRAWVKDKRKAITQQTAVPRKGKAPYRAPRQGRPPPRSWPRH